MWTNDGPLSPLCSSPPPGGEGTWTYMDGDDMDTVEAIEALGGDASFFFDAPPPTAEATTTMDDPAANVVEGGVEKVEKGDSWRLGEALA